MSEEKFIRLNIAFRMPEEVAKAAMKLSRKIAEGEDVYFILDGIEYFPHATNYAVEYPEKNLDKVIEAVEGLVAEFYALEFSFTENVAEQGWVGVHFDYSQSLRKVHCAFIEKLSPLRENRIRENFEDIGTFSSEEEQENIAMHGHPWILNLYTPHLTITKLKNDEIAEKVARELMWPIENFKVDTVGIFIGGEHGTCRKLIKEFKMKK
ncbi:MAG: hypothetical protein ACD_9C00323G0003 [uncultured bacterium]|nr:MAG: hypothetical protein ACD_9C00323G0003 [uncultured bacterium]